MKFFLFYVVRPVWSSQWVLFGLIGPMICPVRPVISPSLVAQHVRSSHASLLEYSCPTQLCAAHVLLRLRLSRSFARHNCVVPSYYLVAYAPRLSRIFLGSCTASSLFGPMSPPRSLISVPLVLILARSSLIFVQVSQIFVPSSPLFSPSSLIFTQNSAFRKLKASF